MSYNGTCISVEGLSKEFKTGKFYQQRTVQALKDVSLEIKEGEVFGLLGPNGSGKTTLIRILCGLIRPTSGKATVFGYDVVKEPMKVRQRISLLPQEASCYENLTARENIVYYGGMYGLTGEELQRRTEELINVVGLKERQNDITKEFSGGMKRKVLVARALVTNPDLVFLDEPTTGIDIVGARVIRNLIKKLSTELNKTIFLTSHDLAEIEMLCDRVGILSEGRLAAIGTPDELEQTFKATGLEDVFIGLSTGEIDFE